MELLEGCSYRFSHLETPSMYVQLSAVHGVGHVVKSEESMKSHQTEECVEILVLACFQILLRQDFLAGRLYLLVLRLSGSLMAQLF